jgi:hypothetical protein
MKRAAPIALTLLVFLFAALSLGVPRVQAQGEDATSTPTPTLTPTPIYEYSFTLTSGDHVRVERSITFGDIAVVTVGLAMLATFIIYLFLRVPKLWH